MGDVDRAQPGALDDAAQLERQFIAKLRIQRPKRLVQHQQARIRRQTARQRDPLLLAAGERSHIALVQALQADALQERLYFLVDFLAPETLSL